MSWQDGLPSSSPFVPLFGGMLLSFGTTDVWTVSELLAGAALKGCLKTLWISLVVFSRAILEHRSSVTKLSNIAVRTELDVGSMHLYFQGPVRIA